MLLFSLLVRVKEQFDVLLQESRLNRHFSKAGGSLDRRLQNINLERQHYDSESEKNRNSLPEESSKRQDKVDYIPRSSGLHTFTFNKYPQKQPAPVLR